MPTERDEIDDRGLAALLDAARAAGPEPSAGLVARVLADADRVAQGRRAVPAPRHRGGWLRDLWDAVGGWQGGAGLAAATVAGMAVGFGSPGAVPWPAPDDGALVEEVSLAVWLWPGVETVIDAPLSGEEG